LRRSLVRDVGKWSELAGKEVRKMDLWSTCGLRIISKAP